jgi:hypothetical protein
MTDANDDAEDRVIARALHGDDTGPDVDAAALGEYREVLSHLPFEERTPPADLEDRVVAAALARRPARATALAAARARRRRATTRWAVLGTAAAVAAAVVAVTTVGSDGDGGLGAEVESVVATRADVDSALALDGTRTAVLQSTETVGRVALTATGDGYVFDLTLPAPEAGRAYWLWLRTGDDAVRAGPLRAGDGTGPVGFTVTGDVGAVRGVFVTLESASEPGSPGPEVAAATF